MEIANNWKELTLSSVATLKARIGWQALRKDEYLRRGEFTLVTGTDFKDGFVNWKSCSYVDKARFSMDKNIQLKENDVLVTKDGTIGKVAIVRGINKPATLNSGVFVIRSTSKDLSQEYLYLIFKSPYFKSYLSRITAGSTITHLYQKDFVYFNFPVPDIHEQKRFVSVFSNIDNLIHKTTKILEKKKNIKQGLMQELLTGKRRLPEFTKNWDGKYKKTDVGNIPIDWDINCLKSFCTFFNGQAHEKFIDKMGKYKLINSKFISTEGGVYKNTNTCIQPLSKGDVVIVMSDIPNGKALAKTFFVESDEKYTLNQRIGGIRARGCFDKFLYYILNRNSYYLSFDSGTGQTNLRKENVLECPIVLPEKIEEQKAICAVLDEANLEIATLSKKLGKYKKIKDGMMQTLLTGEIRLV
ncbi:restriction endonuclease subunit S [Halobacteriovorax sp. JY17]|uniref:restriction endonuclease subunit S n=1 Tax=Halobacteriovorax sp. JY17 TaxID=2014617 RepID=UPI000C603800|nr:restriction endonuclease subunit S [Halobacteriovorax sp. JY17]PIK13546.1 MAG: hypothetical protein CES88_15255 [Halobacteriovorax sp. JY17]